jgi:histidinol-phosphatase
MTDSLVFLEDIIRDAGKSTLKYFQQASTEVHTKHDDSPVTRADREAEELLRSRILREFPQDSILGEEYGEHRGTSQRTWILDPIDGTKTFISGVPLYGTMIGVEEEGDITMGAIYLPVLDELVIAGRGRGCFWNGALSKVSAVDKLEQATLLTTDDRRLRRAIGDERYHEIFDNAGLVRTWGDCYGHVLVITGRAEAMFDPIMKAWDCSPLPVLIEEAGGQYSDFRGRRTIRGGSFLSCNAVLFESLLGMTLIEQPTI